MLGAAELKKEGQEPEEPGRRTSSRLLAAALVFDAVLVVAFGGAVAAKLYQHWKAPAAPAATARAPRKPVKAEPAPAPEPAKAPEPPKQAEAPKPEPPKPEPKAEPAKEAPRPPKPSLLAETPKPRETPKPQAKAPEPAKAPAPAPVVSAPAGKAVPVEFKLKAPSARHVALNGAFIVRGGRKDMARQPDGLWTLTLYLTPNTYRYSFIVDGKRMKDPENPSSSLTVQPQ